MADPRLYSSMRFFRSTTPGLPASLRSALLICAGIAASWMSLSKAEAQPCFPQLAKLVATGETGQGLAGQSVCLSQDGNTALVGAPHDNNLTGAVFVFAQTAGQWAQQGPKLVAAGGVGQAYFGIAVSLSADGNTAAIGAYLDNGSVGAVYVFVRSGGVWAQQGPKLVPSDGVNESQFGIGVSLSADGNTLIGGAQGDNDSIGAACVFIRSGSTWTQQGRKLLPIGQSGQGRFGGSVSLSASGDTALIGADADSPSGAAFVFIRSGTTWAQHGSKLVPADGVGAGHFGFRVSLSAGSTTALIGANGDNGGIGAAYVFASSGGVWTQQGPKLTPVGGVGLGNFGQAVSISGDGNNAIVGAPNDTRMGAVWGAVYMFAKTGSVWAQQGLKVLPTGSVGAEQYGIAFGISAALSGDGGTALVGDYGDNNQIGAGYVFQARSTILITQQPVPVTILPGSTATFSIAANLSAPLTYQWRNNGVNLNNAPTGTGSVITGVTTPTLTVSYAALADSGSAFDCVVTNSCGSARTDPAGLAVRGLCAADFNNSGQLEVADIFAFLNAWFAGCP